MRTMKGATGFLFMLLFLCTVRVRAQTEAILHATAEEAAAGTGAVTGNFVDLVPVMGRYVLVFRRGNAVERHRCKDLWGFTYRGVLFRIDPVDRLPVRLMSQGAVCYYENGLAHLRMLRDGKEFGAVVLGHPTYISRTITGEIVQARFPERDRRGPGARFREAHPELEPLYRCIGDDDAVEHVRQCVVDLEAALEGP